eukprot:498124-Rhodomonas_salina.1
MLKVALVAILVVAFAAPGQGQGSDKELGAGGIWAKVIGQSGKIDLAPSPDVSGHADRMRIEIDSLRELDSSGEEVEKDFTFGDLEDTVYEGYNGTKLDVVMVPFSTTLDAGSKIEIQIFIFKENGNISIGDDVFEVTNGTFKFNVLMYDWVWCGDADASCNQGGVGEMLELDISVVSKDAATKRQDRVDMYEMGGGATMHISDKIMVDGGDWELMPGGAPAMSLQGKKATWTIKFPKFVNSTMYDPTVVYASDETDTTDNTDNTDNTDDSEDTSETDDTDDSDTNGAGDGDGDGEGDDSGADGSGDMTITCAASAAVATCWDGIFEDASIETCDDLTQEMKDMALDCFLSNGCCDDFATNVPMWQQQFGASCAFPTCVSDFSNAVEVTTELAMTAAQFQAPAVKLGFRKAFAEVAGVALGAVKILSVSEKE